MNADIGKMLLTIGIILVITGLLFMLLPKITSLPKLPGDIYIKKENFTFYFPWVTSLLISAILSFIFYFFLRK